MSYQRLGYESFILLSRLPLGRDIIHHYLQLIPNWNFLLPLLTRGHRFKDLRINERNDYAQERLGALEMGLLFLQLVCLFVAIINLSVYYGF